MQLFRIHSPSYEAFDTTGTFFYSGRWHSRGTRIVYTAQHVSLAALEVLVHAGGKKLPPRVLTCIHLPDEISIEEASFAPSLAASQLFGDLWVAQSRSPVLRVPSIPVNSLEFNYLLNPAHPGFPPIHNDPPIHFPFDNRLFITNPPTAPWALLASPSSPR